MKYSKFILLPCMAIFIGYGCQSDNQKNETMVSGISLDYMDSTVNPGDDFFTFVNGGWFNTVEIPEDRSRWGSFDELRKSTSDKVLTVLEEAIKSGKYDSNTDQAKAAIFYQTAMDTAYLNELGIKPLIPEMEKIEKISDMNELVEYLKNTASYQNSYFFGFGVYPDLNNSNINAAFMGAGAFGLPERDYYINEDDHNLYIQDEYKKHIVRMFGKLGINEEDAKTIARQVFEIEKQMASAQMTKEDRRNPVLMNNPLTIDQITQLTSVVDWEEFIGSIGINADTIIVTDPGYLRNLNNIMQDKNLHSMKNYLKWTLFNQSASYLTTELDQLNFDFYGKILNGVPAMRQRWERVLDQANGSIGEAIGKLYTDKYFPPQAKEAAEEMVDNILLAFGKRIENLDWMTDSTKQLALQKLSSFKVKIGYPDQWKSYGDLSIQGKEDGGSYLGNIISITEWNWKEDLEKVGKPVDKSEWFMAPQVVNAYYNPMYNEIVFPAAILQPPFYNYQADPAVNYGGIGAVIGHEISHGFDDQGSKFDADGNLNNWWTELDKKSFEERSKLLVAQYDAYEPIEGVRVNGTFTLGENIGDLGGVNVAYDGLKLHIAQNGDPGLIDGYTQAQRFFISWGTIWRTKIRDEALKTMIATDPHSPGMYRAIGPLVNVDAFYEAFEISENHKLYKPAHERVVIW